VATGIAGCFLALLISACPSADTAAGGTLPELPRAYVDTSLAPSTGNTIAVSAGGDLQGALDRAAPGDVIMLQAGATFTGPFTLPAKSGSGWVTVETNALSSLPAPGNRVDASFAPAMPKLEASSGAVLSTAAGAHHYRFIGLEILPGVTSVSGVKRVENWLSGRGHQRNAATAALLDNLVQLGEGDTSAANLPHHIIFDRCYIHGDVTVGARRGVAMNSAYTAVIDSYISDIKIVGADSQAIASWNGTGPFKIVDDYLEASGENLMFGGTDPTVPGLVPADIEIRGNHLSKPLTWKVDDPSYLGIPWTVKNLLELKNASRVLIEGNLLEYNWAQAQDGFAVLFTVRNQDGTAPWSTVGDVTFAGNVLQHVADGINILGWDNNYPSQQTQRVLIENNLFTDVGGSWGDGALFLLTDGTNAVTIIHNTATQTGTIVYSGAGRPHTGFTYSDNIAPHNQYGFIGTNTGIGNGTLTQYFPAAVIQRNIIVSGPAQAYPQTNFFPVTMDAVGFVNLAVGNYQLAASSPYRNKATDGGNIGADFVSLCGGSIPAQVSAVFAAIPSCAMESATGTARH
jgi:hypothetical protein